MENTKGNKLIELIQNKIGPIADKMQGNVYLSSISDGVSATLSVLMAGSIACILLNLSFTWWNDFIANTGLNTMLNIIQTFALNSMSLIAAVTIAYALATKLDTDPLQSAVLSLIAFLIINPSEGGTMIAVDYIGGQGMVAAILCAIVTVKLIKFCYDKNIMIKMPKGVPSFVEKSFQTIIVGTIIIFLFGILNWLCSKTSYGSFVALICGLIQQPFYALAGSVPGMLIIPLCATLLFFCGVHGMFIVSMLFPIFIGNMMTNLNAVQAGGAPTEIFNMGFWATWMAMGGSGCTIGLVLDMLLFSKSKRYKELGKVALVPQICNVNEPVLYGIPVILNSTMLLPFLLVQALHTIIPYLLTVAGILPIMPGYMTAMCIPSIVGLIINGQGIVGVIVMLGMIALGALIYYPFFKVMDNKSYQAEEEAAKE